MDTLFALRVKIMAGKAEFVSRIFSGDHPVLDRMTGVTPALQDGGVDIFPEQSLPAA